MKDQTLLRKKTNIWNVLTENDKSSLENLAGEYRHFLNGVKTEREAVEYFRKGLEEFGYRALKPGSEPGRVYMVHQHKAIAAFMPGKRELTDGMNIIVAHIDSPRLDLKQNPLYEDQQLAFFKTHYYGGIKKYQWLSRPLALHGVIILRNGSRIDVVIGEDENDPVFTIADLLPHLAGKSQMDKKASEFIEGEKLNLLIGSIPGEEKDDKKNDLVKTRIMEILHERYGIYEEDLSSADLEAVPAGRSRELGFDRSMIAGYGQDDRVCSWAGFMGLVDQKEAERPALLLLLDKEEIGSMGSSGAGTWLLEYFTGQILALHGLDSYANLRACLARSACLSADVNAAVHPDYAAVHDKFNAAYLNEGLVLTKYTGVRGKAGSSEANAEFIASLRNLFDSEEIVYQNAELGRIDEGGGGTIAHFMAYYGMQVMDVGIGLLDMHSPFEISSKADLYMMKKAYGAFFGKYDRQADDL